MMPLGALRVGLVALGFAVVLAGCAPELNWREVRPVEGGWSVLLPGKPESMTRTVRLGELEVAMTMHGARAGEDAYTVAVARLPEGTAADARERVLAGMRSAMVGNIGGRETGAEAVRLPLVDGGGRPVGEVAAVRVTADGQVRGRPARLVAVFAGDGTRVWQAVAVGPGVDDASARTMLDSLRLVR